MEEKEYKLADLVKELRVCERVAYNLLRTGAIKGYKLWDEGGKKNEWRIPQSAIDEYKSRKTNLAIPKLSWCRKNDTEVYYGIICSNCWEFIKIKPFANGVSEKQAKQELFSELPNTCVHCKRKLRI